MPSLTAELSLEMSRFTAGLGKARQEVKSFKGSLEQEGAGLGHSLFKGFEGGEHLLGAVGIGIGVGEYVKGIKEKLDAMHELADASARLRETPEVLQRVEEAGKRLGGLSMDQIAN